jgi:hypothetical protein
MSDPPLNLEIRQQPSNPTRFGSVLRLPARAGDVPWEPWLGEGLVARHYGVSTRTIRRWRRSGMPSRVFGGVRRYRLSECEGWHQQRRSE